MKNEYWAVLVLGFLLLSYVLDGIVQPLGFDLTTPYHFFVAETMSTYPLTTFSVLLKAIAFVAGAVVILGSLGLKRFLKAGVLLVVASLMQLYSYQDVVSGSQALALNWDLGLTLGGLLMLVTSVLFFIGGFFEDDDKYADSASSSPLS